MSERWPATLVTAMTPDRAAMRLGHCPNCGGELSMGHRELPMMWRDRWEVRIDCENCDLVIERKSRRLDDATDAAKLALRPQ